MQKKIFGKIFATMVAAVTAVSAMSVVVSADVNSTAKEIYGTVYKVTIEQQMYSVSGGGYYGTGSYFSYGGADVKDTYFANQSFKNFALDDMKRQNDALAVKPSEATVVAALKLAVSDIASYTATTLSQVETAVNGDTRFDAAGKTALKDAIRAALDSYMTSINFERLRSNTTISLTAYTPLYKYVATETSMNAVSGSAWAANDLVSFNITTGVVTSGGGDYKVVNRSGGGTTNPGQNPNYNGNLLGNITGSWQPYSHLYASGTSYRGSNNAWYPNLEALRSVLGSGATAVETQSSNQHSSRTYFSAYDGRYYTASERNNWNWNYNSNNYYNDDYAYTQWYYTYSLTTTGQNANVYVFYNNYTRRYYTTATAARNASPYGAVSSSSRTISDGTTYGKYFNPSNGEYYDSSYSSSGYEYITTNYCGNSSYSNAGSAYDPYNPYDPYGYGYNPYGYGYGIDPYYLPSSSLGSTSSTSSTAANKYSTTVSLGSNARVQGWTNINNRISNANAGTVVGVNINSASPVVPASIFSTIRGKNVSVRFTNNNGSYITVNGRNVTSAASFDTSVTYGAKGTPASLVSKAKSINKGVSTAQISIGSAGNFGFKADVTVKFSASNAGRNVKLYRYNPGARTLSLVSSAKIGSNGSTTFTGVAAGGDFVTVIY